MKKTELPFRFRPGKIEDSHQVGKILFEAFSYIGNIHGFPPDFPSINIGIDTATFFLSNPKIYSVIVEDTSESKERIIGSNFLDERSEMVAGVGPIAVDPNYQNKGLGRQMMYNVLERSTNRNFPSTRLLQASYHNRSLSLYSKLGFEIREPISTMQGNISQKIIAGRSVRVATETDLRECNAICKSIHGHDRSTELKDSINRGIAKVVLNRNEITGYTSGLSYFNHSVGFTNDDIKALICSNNEGFGGPGILIPSRNTQLFRWCLDNGLKLVQQLTLMTMGLYSEPTGSYMPSILY